MLEAVRDTDLLEVVWLTRAEWNRLQEIVRRHPDARAELVSAEIMMHEVGFHEPQDEPDFGDDDDAEKEAAPVPAEPPVFQPANRTGRAPLGEVAFTVQGEPWYVDDIDSCDTPFIWARPGLGLKVTSHRAGSRLCFVVLDVGNYLRLPKRKNGRRGSHRTFKTAAAAAFYAQQHPDEKAQRS